MLEAYKNMWMNGFKFEGRTSRREYWMAFGMNFAVAMVLGFVANLCKVPVVGTVYNLAALIPTFALCARRMHDINKSGYWSLLNMVPVIGNIWSMVLCAKPAYDEAYAC